MQTYNSSGIHHLASVLGQTLNPANRKEAENILAKMECEVPHLPIHLLEVSLGSSAPSNMAAAVYLKNFVKKHWKIPSLVDDDMVETGQDSLPDADQTSSELGIEERKGLKGALLDALKSRCINASISQIISESISQIAIKDFVLGEWPEFLPFIAALLQENDPLKRCCALQVCTSTFSRYRYEFRTDNLFREINVVMGTIAAPLLAIFIRECGQDKGLFLREQRLLLEIFYSLSAQDIPAFFEENFGSRIVPVIDRILSEQGDDQELIQVQVAACEFIRLYVVRYEEEVGEHLVPLVISILRLLSSSMGSSSTRELVVSEALSVTAAVLRKARFRVLFDESSMLAAVIERIVLPSLLLQEADEEAVGTTVSEATDWIVVHFGNEFVVGQKKLSSSQGELRRRPAAEEVLRALMTAYPEAVRLLLERFLATARSSTDWRLREASIVIHISMLSPVKGSAIIAATSATAPMAADSNPQAVAVLEQEIVPLLRELLPALSSASVSLSSPAAFLASMALRFCTGSIDSIRALNPTLFQLLITLAMKDLLRIRNPLVHLSAALFLERIISLNSEDIISPIERALETIAAVVKLVEEQVVSLAHEPEIMMRLAVHLLYQTRGRLNPPALEMLLRSLSVIVARCGPSPKNPTFTRWIWEAFGLLGLWCPISRDEILGCPVSLTLREGYGDYASYALLVLGVILGIGAVEESRPSQATLMLAGEFVSALLASETWQPGLVGSLGRVLESYVGSNLLGAEHYPVFNTLLTTVLLAPGSSPLKLMAGIRLLRTMIARSGASIGPLIFHAVVSLFGRPRPEGVRRRLAKPLVRLFIHAAAASALDLGTLLKGLNDAANFFPPEVLATTSTCGGSGGEALGLLRLWRSALTLGLQLIPLAEAGITAVCRFKDSANNRDYHRNISPVWSATGDMGGAIRLMASDAMDIPEHMLSTLPVTMAQLEQELISCMQMSTEELLNGLSKENRAQLAYFSRSAHVSTQ